MSIYSTVEAVINDRVRPKLEQHGGDITVDSCDNEGVLYVRLFGSCANCPSVQDTMREVVKAEICSMVPEVKDVVLLCGMSDALMNDIRRILQH